MDDDNSETLEDFDTENGSEKIDETDSSGRRPKIKLIYTNVSS